MSFPSKENVLVALTELHSETLRILTTAKSLSKDSVEEFVSSKIWCMFKFAVVLAKAFKDLGICTKVELNKACEAHFRHADVSEIVEDFWKTEEDWDQLLLSIDKQLDSDDASSKDGGTSMLDIPLVDAHTNETVTLKSLLGSGISFGVREGALRWIKETGWTGRMLLDQQRQLYKSVGLGRSVYKVWSVAALTFYAEQIAAGRTLPQPFENVEDDVHQMGGDFILDKDGRLILSYCSKVSTDRPTMDSLLDKLQ